MTKGDKFINSLTLDIYTYDKTDDMGYIVMTKENGDIRQIGKRYLTSRYIPFSDEVYKQLKNNKKESMIYETSEEI